MLRLQANGKADSTFGVNGLVSFTTISLHDDIISDLFIQADGKIVMGGFTDLWITQPNTNNTENFCLLRYTAQIPTSIPDNHQDVFTIYPNPFSSQIQINSIKKIETIYIFSADGKLLATALNTNTINTQQLPAGQYWLRIISDGVTTLKAIYKIN